MADETSMNDRTDPSGNGLSPSEHGMRGLVHDIVVLGELQARLLALEARAAMQELVWPIAVIVVVVGLILGSVIVGLITVAYLLVELAGWPQYAGYLAAAAVGLAGAGGLLWELQRRWRNRPPVFAKSKEEFDQNFERVKRLLTRSASEPDRNRQP
jgi:hypothetical protein